MTSSSCSQVVRWRDVDKKTWDEIGDLIGRDERTARRWYRKARSTRAGHDPLAVIRRLASAVQRTTEGSLRT